MTIVHDDIPGKRPRKTPPSQVRLIVNIEASSLVSGYPIELAIADIESGSVHAWLIRPHAMWAWDKWNPDSEKIHGLSRATVDRGDDAKSVAQAARRVIGTAELFSDNPEYDSLWLGKLFEAANLDDETPKMSKHPLHDIVAGMARLHSHLPADLEALMRLRRTAADHAAGNDAASWAALIELVSSPAKIDEPRIEHVFSAWRTRAMAVAPWRSGNPSITLSP